MGSFPPPTPAQAHRAGWGRVTHESRSDAQASWLLDVSRTSNTTWYYVPCCFPKSLQRSGVSGDSRVWGLASYL